MSDHCEAHATHANNCRNCHHELRRSYSELMATMNHEVEGLRQRLARATELLRDLLNNCDGLDGDGQAVVGGPNGSMLQQVRDFLSLEPK